MNKRFLHVWGQLAVLVCFCLGISIVETMALTGSGLLTEDFSQEKNYHLNNGCYYLDGDVELSEPIVIESDKTVTIDLNGHVLKQTGVNKRVIENYGDLTITDSATGNNIHYFMVGSSDLWVWDESQTHGIPISPQTPEFDYTFDSANGLKKDGKSTTDIPGEGDIIKVTGGCITGGNITTTGESDYGGGVINHYGSSFVLESGNIVGNSADSGGGVYVYSKDPEEENYSSSFKMTGGSVIGNTAENRGGGVLIKKYGGSSTCVFTMEGGYVIGNRAERGGGVCCCTGGEFKLNNAVISNNVAGSEAGGVYVEGSFTMTGGSVTDNRAVASAGVWVSKNGSLVVGGESKIKNNILIEESGADTDDLCNVSLYGEGSITKKITVDETQPLISGASIGVTLNTTDKLEVFIEASSVDYSEYFTSDNDDYIIVREGSGENQVVKLAEPVALNTDTRVYYATVQEAIDSAADGVVVRLVADSAEDIKINSGKTIILDLNEHVLKGTGINPAITNDGTLTIKDSVEEYYDEPAGSILASGSYLIKSTGALNIQSGTFEASDSWIWLEGNKSSSISGGTFENTNITVGPNENTDTVTLSISGGTFTKCKGSFVQINSGTVNISGGTFTANPTIVARGGIVNITGGTHFAIQNYGGNVTLSGKTYELGKDTGIKNDSGTLTVKNAVITDKYQRDGYYAKCIDATGGRVILENATVKNVNGYGLYVNGAEVILGGTTSITGCSAGNLYLCGGKTIALGNGARTDDNDTVHNGVALPEDGMSIGVKTENEPTESVPVSISEVYSGDYSSYFNSDDSKFYVYHNDNDSRMYLGVASVKVESNLSNGSLLISDQGASAGETVTVTPVLDEGYELDKITVTDKDNNDITEDVLSGTTITIPDSDKLPITVSATVIRSDEDTEDISDRFSFLDVRAGLYFSNAVYWAVQKGITSGMGALSFSPYTSCTRAQMVTFLWRAAGSPDLIIIRNPFVDVNSDDYYYTAVLWAVQRGIVKGTSSTTFSPEDTVKRCQAVTFLARMNGVKDSAAGYSHGFLDVKSTEYYSNAVAWAASNKITEGTTERLFSPDSDCLRCQIVTFLYRCFNA